MSERVLAGWLGSDVPALQQAIVRRAMLDIGITEMPPGSNRSPRIDDYVLAVGSPLGSYWCAAAASAWFRESGAKVPQSEAGSCARWQTWAKQNGLWSSTPQPGYAILFDHSGDGIADHIGVVVRVAPLLLTVEGNTSLGGAASRNGVAVDLKSPLPQLILGYVKPLAVAVEAKAA